MISEPGKSNVSLKDGADTVPSIKPKLSRLPILTLVVAVFVGVISFFSDRLTKIWALAALQDGHTKHLIGNFLFLRLTANQGASLGVGAGSTLVVTIISTIISLTIAYYLLFKARRLAWVSVIAGVIGGAVANLYDRFSQPPYGGKGAVIDFIGYGNIFVGNVADIWIVLGVIIMVVIMAKSVPLTAKPSTCNPRHLSDRTAS